MAIGARKAHARALRACLSRAKGETHASNPLLACGQSPVRLACGKGFRPFRQMNKKKLIGLNNFRLLPDALRRNLSAVRTNGPKSVPRPGRETQMSIRSHSLFQAILARISFGAVPVDGVHWFDPRDVAKPQSRPQSAVAGENAPDADWSPVSLSLTRRFPRAQRKSS